MARFTLALLAALPALVSAQSFTTYPDVHCSHDGHWFSLESALNPNTEWAGFPDGTKCVVFEGMEKYETVIKYTGGEVDFKDFNGGYFTWTYSSGIQGAWIARWRN
ncbi:uncharacterized protein N7473_013108 [Penicillium subrubescens]|uniref:uncharacterized protein n=1 Tax=Penicillium subrubescens TaxID=1316194 RepID=UPI0025458924|nr:uncharacterized protein N7473_013108 [Penicillium subrubescens]KAJ5875761.1 hypothetical protein N7473_013108 [Penicillium subrubescens]